MELRLSIYRTEGLFGIECETVVYDRVTFRIPMIMNPVLDPCERSETPSDHWLFARLPAARSRPKPEVLYANEHRAFLPERQMLHATANVNC